MVVAEGISGSMVGDVHGCCCLQEGRRERVSGLGDGFVSGVKGGKVSEEVSLSLLVPFRWGLVF